MGSILLAIKRQLRGKALPLFCLLLVAAVFASSFLADADSLTPAGVCDADRSGISRSVTSRLEAEGFRVYDTEAGLRRDLERGRLDAAVLLPEGFGSALLSEHPEGCALFLIPSGAFVPELYRNQVSAVLFAEKTPYLTADALDEAGSSVSREDVFLSYRTMTARGSLFSFRILWEGGEEAGGPPPYVTGILSVLLFAGVTLGVSSLLSDRETSPARRIGVRQTFFRLTLPYLGVRMAFWAGSATAGLLLSELEGRGDSRSLIVPALVFLALLTGFAALIQAVFRRSEAVYGFLFVGTLLSWLLLPVWADAALFVPVIARLRILLPPYWLWLCFEHPAVCAALVLPVLAAGGFVLYRELGRRAMKR
jgi:hypothetical protein